jgi:hypothetical protein
LICNISLKVLGVFIPKSISFCKQEWMQTLCSVLYSNEPTLLRCTT